MNDNPLVSVLITTYNKEEYIVDTINSALGQTWPNVEVVVVDDGSSDNTVGLIESTFKNDRVTCIQQENAGPAAAFNNAFAHSKGEYIQILDGDDLLCPEKIETMLKCLADNPEYDAAYGLIASFDDDPSELRSHVLDRTPQMPHGKIWPQIINECFLASHSALIPRRCLEAINGWDENLSSAQDWDLWLRLGHAGCKFFFIDEVFALYRQVSSSISHTPLKPHLNALKVALKIREYADFYDAATRSVYNERLSWLYENAGRSLLKNGRTLSGIGHMLKAVFYDMSKAKRLMLETQSIIRKG